MPATSLPKRGEQKSRRSVLLKIALLSWCAIAISHWGNYSAAAEPALGPTNPPSGTDDLTQLSLEQLGSIKVQTVYGASKHEQKVTEAPSSVSIVTQDEVKAFGYRTLADILRSVRGVNVSYDRLYGYVGIRGFNRPGDFGGRTLILVDGHRLNEPLFDGAFNVTDFLLDVDLIERVEVIRGPGSTLYGDNAFSGIINVVTRRGENVNGAEVASSIASYDSYQSRITYGNRFTNGLELLLSGSCYDSRGQTRLYEPAFDTPDQNNGVAHLKDGDSFQSIFASVHYHQLTLEGGYISRNKNAPLAPYDTLFNAPQPTVDRRGFVSLDFNDTLASDWTVAARVYYDYYGANVDYPTLRSAPGEPEQTVVNKERDAAHWAGVEGSVSRTFFDRHRLTLGAEVRDDFDLALHSFNVEPYELVSNVHDAALRTGVFVQDEYSIYRNLDLHAGLRYDYYSSFGGTLNPRAGLIYRPFDKTVLKLLYGQAYRAPNLFELSGAGIDAQANPNLVPEEIRTYEIVCEQYLPSNLRLSLSGFYSQTDHLISQTVDPTADKLFYTNIDSAETKGLEMEAEYRTPGGVLARASYALQRTQDTTTGKEFSNSPRHLVKGNLAVPLWGEKLGGGLELQVSSRALTLPGRAIDSASAYWVANLTLYSREIIKGLELSASLYNLFDEKYAYPGGDEYVPPTIRQDGRTFRLKVMYRF